jgi:DNA-binding transcriptional LysR family regulator
MIAVRVTGARKIAVVATPSYFAQHGPPQTPDDLLGHGCIQYRVSNGRLFEWMFERDGERTTLAVNGRVIVNSCELALRAAADGLGLAYVIESEAGPLLRSGELARVLEEWSPAVEGLYLHHPSHRQMPAA